MDEKIGGVSIGVEADFSDLNAQFDRAISAAVAESKKMGDALANAFRTPDAGPVAQGFAAMGSAADDAAKEIDNSSQALDRARDALGRFVSSSKEAEAALRGFTDAAGSITQVGAGLTAAITVPLAGLGLAAVKTAGELEQTTVAFKTLLGGSDQALAHLQQLRDFAAATPFEFKDLTDASKKMQALGFSAQEVIPTLKIIGDTAAGLGSGAQGIERITLALGQMKAKGAVSAEEMRQLAEAGIPAWQILAKVLDTTVAGAMDLVTKKAVDSAQAVPALLAGMNEKFGGLMEAQSKTLLGVWSNFKDSLTFTLTDIGTALAPIAKSMMENVLLPALDVIKKLAAGFAELPEPVKVLSVALAGLAAAIGPILVAVGGLGLAMSTVPTAIAGLESGLALLSGTASGLGATITGVLGVSLSEILIPIAAVGAAIAVLEFTGVADDIMAFVQGPLERLKEGFSIAAGVIKQDFADLGSSLQDAVGAIRDLFQDLGPLIKDMIELSWKPLVDIIKSVGATFGLVTPDVISFRDVVKTLAELSGVGMALETISAALKGIKTAIDIVRPSIQLLTGDTSTLKTATKDTAEAMRLQQDLANQNARLLADQAMGLNQAATATDAYAKGLKSIQDKQEKLNDAVKQAKGVLDAAKAAYDDGNASIQDVNRATEAYEKALKAANAQTDASKQAHKDAAAAAKEHQKAIEDLNKELDKANTALGNVADSYEDYVKSLQDGGKTAVQQIKDIDAAIDALVKQQMKLKDPSAVEGIQAMIDKLKAARTELKSFAEEDAWNKVALKINDFANKYPGQIQKLPEALQAVVKAAQDTATNVSAALDRVDFAGLIGKWLAATDGLDKANQKMADNFLKAGDKMHDAATKPLPIVADLRQRLSDVDVTLQGIAEKKPWDPSPITRYLDAVKDLNAAGVTTLQQQDAQIAKLKQLVSEAAALNIPVGEQLKLQGDLYAQEIKNGELQGKNVEAAIYGLEHTKIATEELRIATHGLADTYVAMLEEVNKAFGQISKSLADVIVDGKNFGDAMASIMKNLAKEILGTLIEGALKPLKKEILGLEDSLLKQLNPALKDSEEGVKKLSDASEKAAEAQKGLGSTAAAAASAVSSLASTINVVTGIIQAGAAVASTILLAHISSDTGHIEVNTREIEAQVTNLWETTKANFETSYYRLGEVKNALDTISDTLKQILAAGGGGGFPEQALSDLDSIAHDVHDIDARFPTLQGALQTIATDIVTWGGYIVSDLDVIVQKMGQLLTSSLSANDAMESLATGSELDAAASGISAAIGEAADQTGNDLVSQASVITGSITTQGNRAAAAAATQLSAAERQYTAAHSTAEQLAALKEAYAQYSILETEAIRRGDLDLAAAYHQQIQNLQQQLTPLLSADVSATQQVAAAVTSGASTMAFAATGAGVLVATAVNNSAAAIASAVSSALANSAAFRPTGGGTTTSAGGTSTTSSPTNPGVPVGTQPGFSPVPKPSTGTTAPTAPPVYYPTTVTGAPIPPTTTYPHFESGGAVLETGGAIVDKGEIVKPASKGTAPAEPDYAAILAAAMKSDRLLQTLVDQVESQKVWISQAIANHAPPAMMALLQEQLEGYQKGLTLYEVQMGYAKQTAEAVTKPPQPTGGPAHPVPGTPKPEFPGIPGAPGSGGSFLENALASLKETQRQDAEALLAQQRLLGQTFDHGKQVEILAKIAEFTKKVADDQTRIDAMVKLLGQTGGTVPGNPTPSIPQGEKPPTTTSTPPTTKPPTPTTGGTLVVTDPARPLAVYISSSAPVYKEPTQETPVTLPPLSGGPTKPGKTGGTEPAPASPGGFLENGLTALQSQAKADAAELLAQQRLLAQTFDHGKQVEILAKIADYTKKVADDDARIKAMTALVSATGGTIPGSPATSSTQTPAPPAGPGGSFLENGMASLKEQAKKDAAELLATQRLLGQTFDHGKQVELLEKIAEFTKKVSDDNARIKSMETLVGATGGTTPGTAKPTTSTLPVDLGMPTPGNPATGPTPATTPAAPPSPPAISVLQDNLDPRTVGFYAGSLAELEDIRNTIHSERDLISSMRDGLVMIAKELVIVMGGEDGKEGKPRPSFDLGGPVPYNMTADLHGGEYVLPADITSMMRSMMRTPNYYGRIPTADYDGAKQGGKIINITAPVTVISRGDPRQAAEQFVTHMKKMVPDAGAFSS